MQKLVPTMQKVLESMNDVRIDKLTVLNGGSNGGGNLAAQIVATNEQIKAATGLDVPQLVKDRFAAPGTPLPPPPPTRR
jgi:flotillin